MRHFIWTHRLYIGFIFQTRVQLPSLKNEASVELSYTYILANGHAKRSQIVLYYGETNLLLPWYMTLENTSLISFCSKSLVAGLSEYNMMLIL